MDVWLDLNSPCTFCQHPGHTPCCDSGAPGTDHTPDTPAPGLPHSTASAPPCAGCSVGAPVQEPSLPPPHLPGRLQCRSPPDRDSNSPLCWQRCDWACSTGPGTSSCTEGRSRRLLGWDSSAVPSSPRCNLCRRCDRRAKRRAA